MSDPGCVTEKRSVERRGIQMKTFLGIAGATFVLYLTIRLVATIYDVFLRWRDWRRGDKHAWDVSTEEDN